MEEPVKIGELFNGASNLSVSAFMRQVRENSYARYREDAISKEIASLLLETMQDSAVSQLIGLDIGSGNGAMARRVETATEGGALIQGIDLSTHRYCAKSGASTYNGTLLPFQDHAFDFALLIDVLHHTSNPLSLLSEASRVARHFVIVKDHAYEHRHEFMLLSFMDLIGNLGYGNSHHGAYKKETEWHELFQSCRLVPQKMIRELHIYPFPFSVAIRPELNFVALLKAACQSNHADHEQS